MSVSPFLLNLMSFRLEFVWREPVVECVLDGFGSYSDTGAQPLTNEDGTLVLAVNGEIYNHRQLRKSLKQPAKFKTHSDCEVILHLVRSPFFFPLHLPWRSSV